MRTFTRYANSGEKLSSKEEVKLLRTVLAELVRQADNDISVFTYSLRRNHHVRESDDYDDGSSATVAKSLSGQKPFEINRDSLTYINVRFSPEYNQNHPNREVSKVELEWCTQTGHVTMSLRWSVPNHNQPAGAKGNGLLKAMRSEDYDSGYHIGHNNDLDGESGKFKKDLLALYKKIRHHREVELVQQRKQEMEAAIYETFPALLDNLVLGEEDG